MNESDRYKSAIPPTRIEIEDAYPELATPFCVQEEEILENETPTALISSPRPETPQPEQKMTTKRKLNVRLLRKIQRHILEEPRRFFMEGFIIKGDEQWEATSEWYYDLSKTKPPCGTAACIAGWTAILSGHPRVGLPGAAKILGLGNELKADSVFYTTGWPYSFRDSYARAKTPKQRAKIACARIDHLIKTGE